MGLISRSLLAFIAAIAFAGTAEAQGKSDVKSPDCQLTRLAEIPVTVRGSSPLLDAKINGAPVQLLLDSGSFWSFLSYAKAEELGLKLSALPPGMRVGGIGGRANAKSTRVDSFAFSEWSLKKAQFVVAAVPSHDGVMGQNILQFVDVEYDFSKGMVRFFHLKGCKDRNLAYWATGRASNSVPLVPFDAAPTMTTTYAYINGERIRVLIDTGANTTLLTTSAARRAGVNLAEVEATHIGGGLGRKALRTSTVRLDKFKIGDEEVSNAPVQVADLDVPFDMLLGFDFLSSHRVLVSNEQKKIFFTYEGGPVFNTETSAFVFDPAGGLIEAEEAKPEELADADAYARRAAASQSRNALEEAEADFTRAIELEPSNPKHHVARAMLRLDRDKDGDRAGALADVEAALKLQAGDAEALVLRAALRATDDAAAALTDAHAASAALPAQADLRMRLGALYGALGERSRAIAEYTAWIDAHSDDFRLPAALNGRCWARAQANIELDLALKDCDLAVRRTSGGSAILDSRGLLHLRRREYREAIADYDRALKAAPGAAWSLFGRSLANRALGNAAAAEGDLAAARQADPKIDEKAKEIGL